MNKRILFLITTLLISTNTFANSVLLCKTKMPFNGNRHMVKVSNIDGQFHVKIVETFYFHGEFPLSSKVILSEGVAIENLNGLVIIKGDKFDMEYDNLSRTQEFVIHSSDSRRSYQARCGSFQGGINE